jgi:hypothetical protein
MGRNLVLEMGFYGIEGGVIEIPAKYNHPRRRLSYVDHRSEYPNNITFPPSGWKLNYSLYYIRISLLEQQ